MRPIAGFLDIGRIELLDTLMTIAKNLLFLNLGNFQLEKYIFGTINQHSIRL